MLITLTALTALMAAVVVLVRPNTNTAGFPPGRYFAARVWQHLNRACFWVACIGKRSEFLYRLVDLTEPRAHAWIAHPLGMDTFEEIDAMPGWWDHEYMEEVRKQEIDELLHPVYDQRLVYDPLTFGPRHLLVLSDAEQAKRENNTEALDVLREKLTGVARPPRHRAQACWAANALAYPVSDEDLDAWATDRVEH